MWVRAGQRRLGSPIILREAGENVTANSAASRCWGSQGRPHAVACSQLDVDNGLRQLRRSLHSVQPCERYSGLMQIRRLDERASLVVLGDAYQSGSYVLRISVQEPAEVAFGRFDGGKPIQVPSGEYAYVGSAMADRGPSSLARRLVRHATRTEDLPPHGVRASMLMHFPRVGLGEGDLLPRGSKRRHWHVDYLLDLPRAEMTCCFALRWPVRLESEVARLLEVAAQTSVLASGLGANDAAEATHLLRVRADDRWWEGLPHELARLTDHARDRSRA